MTLIKDYVLKLGYQKLIIYKGGIKRGIKIYEGEPPYEEIPEEILNASLVGYEIDCKNSITYLEMGLSK